MKTIPVTCGPNNDPGVWIDTTTNLFNMNQSDQYGALVALVVMADGGVCAYRLDQVHVNMTKFKQAIKQADGYDA